MDVFIDAVVGGTEKLRKQKSSRAFSYSPSFIKEGVFCGLTRCLELPIPVPQPRSAFHPRAQRNAFHRRDARQQSRSFARGNQSLTRSPNSNRLC
jgi:hypothetical protein